MVWAVFTDQEALDLLDAAAEMAAAALAARSRRIDEDGVLRRSVDMSRIKLQTAREAFRSAPLGRWSDLSEKDAQAVERLFAAFIGTVDARERNAIWKNLLTYFLRPGPGKSITGGQEPWGDEDLPKPGVRSGAKKPARRKADL